MTAPSEVVIVMATCNGEAYLEAQIQSIREQTFRDWTLLAHDDLSVDRTREILREQAREDPRIEVLETPTEARLGPARNFDLLLREALARGAEFVFLSDQDDVWLPEKVAVLLSDLAVIDSQTPALAYSDMSVADSSLSILKESFMECQGFRHESDDPLRVLLVQNFVTGCASAVNRSLLELVLPIPLRRGNHDWWLAVGAAAAGVLSYDPRPLLLYRQHEANVIGTFDPGGHISRRILQIGRLRQRHSSLLQEHREALRLLARKLGGLTGEFSSSATRRIDRFVQILDCDESRIARWRNLKRGGFQPQNWRRKLLLFLSI